MALLPFPVFFCRRVPVADLTHKNQVHTRAKAPWFEKLKEDIATRGMASPLLVYHETEQLERRGPMKVKTGQNRLFVLRELGWKHAPCIIVCDAKGPLPPYDDMVPLRTLSEVQAKLADGIAATYKHLIRINSAKMPEQMVYPKVAEPYFDVD